MFRDQYPIAWGFHKNTGRSLYPAFIPPSNTDDAGTFKEYPDAPMIPLPAVPLPEAGIGSLIKQRLSCRNFGAAALSMTDLAALLQGAYGVQGHLTPGGKEFLERPVPSGGAMYPLELYVFALRLDGCEPGIYHYMALYHALEQLPGPLTSAIAIDLFAHQSVLTNAAAIIVIAAEVKRTLWKYGDRGYRYILFEAGHVAQNLNLLATACAIGSVNLGGFYDDDLAQHLGLDPDVEVPLYALALGKPVADDRLTLRQLDDALL